MAAEPDAPSPGDGPPTPGPATRTISWTLFRYFACEFFVPLVCCVGGFVALFLITDIFDVLRDFVEAKAPAKEVALYFVLRQPANLVNVLPMSILLSVSFMLNILGRHHEITAVRAAGLSLVRCCMPVWLGAAAFGALALWINESLAPEWSLRAEELLEESTTSASFRATGRSKLAYRNEAGRRDWFFEGFSRHGEKRGVLVKQFRPDRTVLWELRAGRAEYEGGAWVFYAGAISRFDEQGSLPVGPEQDFERLCLSELDELPGKIVNSLRPAEELPISEICRLLRVNTSLPRRTKRMLLTSLWYRLSSPFSCLIAALLGVALSLGREKSSALRGFALAVGIMVLFYVAGQVFVVFGKNGFLPPVVAGCLPTLLFIGWGCWAVYERR